MGDMALWTFFTDMLGISHPIALVSYWSSVMQLILRLIFFKTDEGRAHRCPPAQSLSPS